VGGGGQLVSPGEWGPCGPAPADRGNCLVAGVEGDALNGRRGVGGEKGSGHEGTRAGILYPPIELMEEGITVAKDRGATGCCGVEGTEVAVAGNGAFAPPGETASEGAEHVARDLPLHCE
jgi:hypothetical protein